MNQSPVLNRSTIQKLFAVLFMFAAQGCGTTRGYEGAALPPEKLATIHDTRAHKMEGTSDAVYLCKVDSKVVGSYYRGFPEYVEVVPGKHTVRVRYYDARTDHSMIAGLLGGAIGGSIYEAARDKSALFRDLAFDAVAGSEYSIEFDSTTTGAANARIWIKNGGTGEIVSISSANAVAQEVSKRAPPTK